MFDGCRLEVGSAGRPVEHGGSRAFVVCLPEVLSGVGRCALAASGTEDVQRAEMYQAQVVCVHR